MNRPPRAVYSNKFVDAAVPEQMLVKYMSWKKFQDLVSRSAIYFRRIDGFKDQFEGRIPLAVWDLSTHAFKDWYNHCKDEIFITCWNMDRDETKEMWSEYAESYGVRISCTVDALTTELSIPPLVSCYSEPVEWAEKTNIQIVDDQKQDGFTLGKIKYINFDDINTHDILGEGLSNIIPVFRKRDGYVNENEFRVVLRPGSASGEAARTCGDMHVFVSVCLQNLIQEIRFAPVNDPILKSNIEDLLAKNGLDIPVNPASLKVTQ
ncbi:hypothetical protein [Gimesia chilikensis]|uniref:hypothetical protein n=1 Tax=Gimesia chilikensis TaxID=2605989 RepID=UPI003A8E7C7E